MARLSRSERACESACRAEITAGVGQIDPAVQKAGPYLRVRDFAEVYGVSESTVREWIRKGRLKFKQPAGKGGIIFVSPGLNE